MMTTRVLILVALLVETVKSDTHYNTMYKQINTVEESKTTGIAIDTDTVYAGVLDPNNILIHVTQNLVNFMASSLAWMVLLPLYQGTTGGRRKRGTEDASDGKLMSG